MKSCCCTMLCHQSQPLYLSGSYYKPPRVAKPAKSHKPTLLFPMGQGLRTTEHRFRKMFCLSFVKSFPDFSSQKCEHGSLLQFLCSWTHPRECYVYVYSRGRWTPIHMDIIWSTVLWMLQILLLFFSVYPFSAACPVTLRKRTLAELES